MEGDDIIGIGQMPNNMQAGMSVTVKYGFLANNKIVILKIKVNIVGYEDPEEKPAGDPKTVEFDVPLTKAYDNTYSKVEYDVQDILKDAFKMTTYEIFKAKNDGSLKVYLNEVTEEDPSYTADAPGYWMSAEGVAGPYADGVIWLTLGASETSLYLYGGNHPVNCSTDGQTVATKFIITCNGGKAIFNVTYEITKSESAE